MRVHCSSSSAGLFRADVPAIQVITSSSLLNLRRTCVSCMQERCKLLHGGGVWWVAGPPAGGASSDEGIDPPSCVAAV
jgi:hypothetical protein